MKSALHFRSKFEGFRYFFFFDALQICMYSAPKLTRKEKPCFSPVRHHRSWNHRPWLKRLYLTCLAKKKFMFCKSGSLLVKFVLQNKQQQQNGCSSEALHCCCRLAKQRAKVVVIEQNNGSYSSCIRSFSKAFGIGSGKLVRINSSCTNARSFYQPVGATCDAGGAGLKREKIWQPVYGTP